MFSNSNERTVFSVKGNRVKYEHKAFPTHGVDGLEAQLFALFNRFMSKKSILDMIVLDNFLSAHPELLHFKYSVTVEKKHLWEKEWKLVERIYTYDFSWVAATLKARLDNKDFFDTLELQLFKSGNYRKPVPVCA